MKNLDRTSDSRYVNPAFEKCMDPYSTIQNRNGKSELTPN